jgi:hypothetical protein
MARRDPVGIRLITRNGHDWAARYPLVVEAVNHLKVRSCLLDGEVGVLRREGAGDFPASAPQTERAPGIPLRLRPAGTERRRPEAGTDRGAKGDAGQHPAEEPSRIASQ